MHLSKDDNSILWTLALDEVQDPTVDSLLVPCNQESHQEWSTEQLLES